MARLLVSPPGLLPGKVRQEALSYAPIRLETPPAGDGAPSGTRARVVAHQVHGFPPSIRRTATDRRRLLGQSACGLALNRREHPPSDGHLFPNRQATADAAESAPGRRTLGPVPKRVLSGWECRFSANRVQWWACNNCDLRQDFPQLPGSDFCCKCHEVQSSAGSTPACAGKAPEPFDEDGPRHGFARIPGQARGCTPIIAPRVGCEEWSAASGRLDVSEER